ncbi:MULTISPECIES: hypothetical protein [Acidobacteriaceae]|uniref:hypothetical protein n=1 Tax=Acidobacteriaceae TaxID=204434 RepID=UPI00131B17E8|nr:MULTISPECIES: hypothetical protein [Acidobacteriaceae]MDW5266931.1 hypothetical protein [Edaphobacter sp.]
MKLRDRLYFKIVWYRYRVNVPNKAADLSIAEISLAFNKSLLGDGVMHFYPFPRSIWSQCNRIAAPYSGVGMLRIDKNPHFVGEIDWFDGERSIDFDVSHIPGLSLIVQHLGAAGAVATAHILAVPDQGDSYVSRQKRELSSAYLKSFAIDINRVTGQRKYMGFVCGKFCFGNRMSQVVAVFKVEFCHPESLPLQRTA